MQEHTNIQSDPSNDIEAVKNLYNNGKLSFDEAKEYITIIENRGAQKKSVLPEQPKSDADSPSDSQEKNVIDTQEQKEDAENPEPNNTQEKNNVEAVKFYDTGERIAVYNYLKECGADNESELKKISGFIREIENSAVERFKESQAQKASITNENAKARLTSACESPSTEVTSKKVYTREEIASMSNDDFLMHEKEIERQMLEGKIK